MKRALILCLLWAMSINSGICATTMFPPLQPLGGNGLSNKSSITSIDDPFASNPYLSDSNVSYPRISEIEHSLYGQKFTAQDILVRLARIEKTLFSTSYPRLALSQRVDNIIMNFNQINKYSNISNSTLSGIEAKVLRKSYGQNNTEERIERLEQQIFGAVQSGDLEERFETLKAASQGYNRNQYAPTYNQNTITSGRGGWKNIVGNIGGMLLGGGPLGGTMTGFTPSLDPYNSNNNYNTYNNGYNNYNNFANLGYPSGNGLYSGYRTNHGYSDTFNNYGSGSRVTILE